MTSDNEDITETDDERVLKEDPSNFIDSNQWKFSTSLSKIVYTFR